MLSSRVAFVPSKAQRRAAIDTPCAARHDTLSRSAEEVASEQLMLSPMLLLLVFAALLLKWRSVHASIESFRRVAESVCVRRTGQ